MVPRLLALALTVVGCGGAASATDAGADAHGADAGLACTPRALPTGAAPGTNELMPGAQRLRSATSPDGLAWKRTDMTIADQAATPSLTRTADGRPLLLYTAHAIDAPNDGVAAAIGAADGRAWQHCALAWSGMPAGVRATDPDVVQLSDGTYRMYFTSPVPGVTPARAGIFRAESRDGLAWSFGGAAFPYATTVIDPMTFRAGGAWHQYALDGMNAAMVHGTSADGQTFAFSDVGQRTIGGEPYVLSQATQVGDVVRVYGFGPMGQSIRSFTTTNGADLTPDPAVLLALDASVTAERTFIKDPAVVRLSDGGYLMVYSTVIP